MKVEGVAWTLPPNSDSLHCRLNLSPRLTEAQGTTLGEILCHPNLHEKES